MHDDDVGQAVSLPAGPDAATVTARNKDRIAAPRASAARRGSGTSAPASSGGARMSDLRGPAYPATAGFLLRLTWLRVRLGMVGAGNGNVLRDSGLLTRFTAARSGSQDGWDGRSGFVVHSNLDVSPAPRRSI